MSRAARPQRRMTLRFDRFNDTFGLSSCRRKRSGWRSTGALKSTHSAHCATPATMRIAIAPSSCAGNLRRAFRQADDRRGTQGVARRPAQHGAGSDRALKAGGRRRYADRASAADFELSAKPLQLQPDCAPMPGDGVSNFVLRRRQATASCSAVRWS